jgi:hypothetical protein
MGCGGRKRVGRRADVGSAFAFRASFGFPTSSFLLQVPPPESWQVGGFLLLLLADDNLAQ